MLTREQVREFEDVGMIVAPSLFDAAEIENMSRCFDALEEMALGLSATGMLDGAQFVLGEKNGHQVINRVVWAGGSQPDLLAIGADERLALPAAQLLHRWLDRVFVDAFSVLMISFQVGAFLVSLCF